MIPFEPDEVAGAGGVVVVVEPVGAKVGAVFVPVGLKAGKVGAPVEAVGGG